MDNKRGPNDLEEQIDMLTKQKEYLQKKCREAGEKYNSLEKEYDKVCEERDNFVTMLGDGDTIPNKLTNPIDTKWLDI